MTFHRMPEDFDFMSSPNGLWRCYLDADRQFVLQFEDGGIVLELRSENGRQVARAELPFETVDELTDNLLAWMAWRGRKSRADGIGRGD